MRAATPTCWRSAARISAERAIKPARAKGPTSATPSETDRAAPPPVKRRLSFHEKHALETLPDRIATLQADIRRLQRRLDEPDLYARDQKAFAEASNAFTAAQSELATAEEKWLVLEILREEIEGR